MDWVGGDAAVRILLQHSCQLCFSLAINDLAKGWERCWRTRAPLEKFPTRRLF